MRPLLIAAATCVLQLISSGALSATSKSDFDIPEIRAACPNVVIWLDRRNAEKAGENAPAPVASSAPPLSPQLRRELLDMQREDQHVRNEFPGLRASPQAFSDHAAKMRAVDLLNLRRIRAIVREHGFPTRALVGEDGVGAAWVLVQHADENPGFQSRVLEQISARVKTGEISGQQFALLSDRVLVGRGLPQRYGTQAPLKDGAFVAYPIADAEHVDDRRAQMGLPPLDVYLCGLNVLYSQPQRAQ